MFSISQTLKNVLLKLNTVEQKKAIGIKYSALMLESCIIGSNTFVVQDIILGVTKEYGTSFA